MIETSFWIAARDNSKMIGTRFLGSAAEDSNWPPTALASPPSPAPSAHYAEQTASLTLFLTGTISDNVVLCQREAGFCHLRIKSEQFLADLKFKSELL